MLRAALGARDVDLRLRVGVLRGDAGICRRESRWTPAP